MSNHGSPLTTPSPNQRNMSMSPNVDMSNGGMPRHGDFSYLQQTGSLPVHMRVGSPIATAPGPYNTIRPTSHPTSYGPPPTLEPSLEQHQSAGAGSANNSPHMASVGWQSPPTVPSPSQNGASYVYPDPEAYPTNPAMNQMYYGAPHMRRPQSAEPGLVNMA